MLIIMIQTQSSEDEQIFSEQDINKLLSEWEEVDGQQIEDLAKNVILLILKSAQKISEPKDIFYQNTLKLYKKILERGVKLQVMNRIVETIVQEQIRDCIVVEKMGFIVDLICLQKDFDLEGIVRRMQIKYLQRTNAWIILSFISYIVKEEIQYLPDYFIQKFFKPFQIVIKSEKRVSKKDKIKIQNQAKNSYEKNDKVVEQLSENLRKKSDITIKEENTIELQQPRLRKIALSENTEEVPLHEKDKLYRDIFSYRQNAKNWSVAIHLSYISAVIGQYEKVGLGQMGKLKDEFLWLVASIRRLGGACGEENLLRWLRVVSRREEMGEEWLRIAFSELQVLQALEHWRKVVGNRQGMGIQKFKQYRSIWNRLNQKIL